MIKRLIVTYESWDCEIPVAVVPLEVAESIVRHETRNTRYHVNHEPIQEYDTLQDFCAEHRKRFKVCKDVQ